MSKSPPLVASLLLLSLTGCGPSNSGSATNQPGAPSAAEDESAADAAVKKLNGKTVAMSQARASSSPRWTSPEFP